MTVRAEAIDQLRRALLASRNSDGGWGYHAGKHSRLEPTAWALLALAEDPAADTTSALVEVLARWQRPDGLLTCVPSAPPNLAFNGLATIALLHAAHAHPDLALIDPLLGRLLRGIVAIKGSTFSLAQRAFLWLVPSATTSQQDNDLRGWPWVEGTFSWVEPTAWCLLALKRSRLQMAPAPGAGRIEEAERLLLDRCCTGGGWNYGNSNMLGKQLMAYVPTTAVGLLAMRDRRVTAEVRRSVDFLARHRTAEVSGMALSLAAIALGACGLPVEDVEEALIEDVTRTGLPNNAVRAMALCALAGGSGDATPFAV